MQPDRNSAHPTEADACGHESCAQRSCHATRLCENPATPFSGWASVGVPNSAIPPEPSLLTQHLESADQVEDRREDAKYRHSDICARNVVAVAVIMAARQGEQSASPSGAVPTSGIAEDLPFGARTFRAIAAEHMPTVVNIRNRVTAPDARLDGVLR